MIETDSEKPSPAQAGAATPDKPAETTDSLAAEAEAFCEDLERFFKRALGGIPGAVAMGELRGQQATVRDMVQRASNLGGGAGEQLAAMTTERDKLKDSAVRARADFLNYQSRSAKDLERAEELALR